MEFLCVVIVVNYYGIFIYASKKKAIIKNCVLTDRWWIHRLHRHALAAPQDANIETGTEAGVFGTTPEKEHSRFHEGQKRVLAMCCCLSLISQVK